MALLKKVAFAGYLYKSVFELPDGSRKIVAITKDDYYLNKGGRIDGDNKWLYSFEHLDFNGRLKDGEYSIIPARDGNPEYKLVKLTGLREGSIAKGDIVNNEIQVRGMNKVKDYKEGVEIVSL